MDIGDMVVRAYAYRAFIPGIIVDEEWHKELPDPDNDPEAESWTDHVFIIAWSDGSTSKEMSIELDDLTEALVWHQKSDKEIKAYLKSTGKYNDLPYFP